MTKEENRNYVMTSPENTNPAVLDSMLDSLPNGEQEVMVVTLGWDDGEIYFFDYEYSEVLAASKAGKRIVWKPTGEDHTYCDLVYRAAGSTYVEGFLVFGMLGRLSRTQIVYGEGIIYDGGSDADVQVYSR